MTPAFTALYPVVVVESPQESGRAFAELFDVHPVFDTDWYLHLVSSDGRRQIGFVRIDHESVPEAFRSTVRGTFVTMDSTDVRGVWEQKHEALDVVVPLKDESWGQRHFICRLPGDVLVDVVQMLSNDS